MERGLALEAGLLEGWQPQLAAEGMLATWAPRCRVGTVLLPWAAFTSAVPCSLMEPLSAGQGPHSAAPQAGFLSSSPDAQSWELFPEGFYGSSTWPLSAEVLVE